MLAVGRLEKWALFQIWMTQAGVRQVLWQLLQGKPPHVTLTNQDSAMDLAMSRDS